MQDNVIGHVPGEGETAFEWSKRRSGHPFEKADDDECSSIFIEPLQWMKSGTGYCIAHIIFVIPLPTPQFPPHTHPNNPSVNQGPKFDEEVIICILHFISYE